MDTGFNPEEQFLYDRTYLFIKGYATGRKYTQTLKALPLARKFHAGQYRKGEIEIDGVKYRLPYVLHVLKVCSTLISLELPMEHDELDTLYASALLHDSLEDCDEFKQNSKQVMLSYGISESVYDCIQAVSKQSGYTDEDLDRYFDNISKNKIAILVKLADRSHNVEDLYNMRIEKLHKYVRETRRWIYPLAAKGKADYPELSNGFTILKSKIISLTECTETIVDMYEEVLAEKNKEIDRLRKALEDKNNSV